MWGCLLFSFRDRNFTLIVTMLSRYAILFVKALLIEFVSCDTSIGTGINYYISSDINPNFITNLVAYSDGTSNWPGIGKDEAGSPGYGKWQLTNGPGGNSYRLENGVGKVLDITGGTSSSPANPRLFLNSEKNEALNGQGWSIYGAQEPNLHNAANGFWGAIVNVNWNLALTVPVMPAGIEAEKVELGPVPTAWEAGKYWFFASITRGTVWQTATVTSTTTSTRQPTTQTVDADGPTSTITSTVVRTSVGHLSNVKSGLLTFFTDNSS